MATRRIREFLAGNKTAYQTIHHTCAYTAQEVAEASHVPGQYMAKVVVVWLDKKLALVVVPATRIVDLAKLRKDTGAANVRLAEESEFRDRFSECQLGTVPPFGNLFGLETFMDEQLTICEQIAFNAGTHQDVIILGYRDFIRLVRPRIVDVAAEPCLCSTVAKKYRARKHAAEGACAVAEPVVQVQCGCRVEIHDGAD
jgi:Ala-tRNA(Pro) deacylase